MLAKKYFIVKLMSTKIQTPILLLELFATALGIDYGEIPFVKYIYLCHEFGIDNFPFSNCTDRDLSHQELFNKNKNIDMHILIFNSL